MKKKPRLEFSHIMFSGSSYREYEQFFNLDAKALVGQRILDCPSGAASFAVDARKLGLNVVAVDPQFERPLEELRAQGTNDIDQVSERYHEKQEMHYWELFAHPKELEAQRRSSLEAFCSDFQEGKARGDYIAAHLPNLPFDDNEFVLVLSGHLLFLYADYLDYNFHLDSIVELLRVTRNEVRIYPICGEDASPYPEMDRLLTDLSAKCSSTEIVPCRLRLIRGFEEDLSIRK